MVNKSSKSNLCYIDSEPIEMQPVLYIFNGIAIIFVTSGIPFGVYLFCCCNNSLAVKRGNIYYEEDYRA